jgi:hypothetical protein
VWTDLRVVEVVPINTIVERVRTVGVLGGKIKQARHKNIRH